MSNDSVLPVSRSRRGWRSRRSVGRPRRTERRNSFQRCGRADAHELRHPALLASRPRRVDRGARAPGRGRRLRRRGVRGRRLLYHNHDHELVTVEGEPALDRLAEESGIGFELDLAWILAAGYDPVAYIDRYADRTPVVHLKDVVLDADAKRGGRPVPLGEGELDIDRCLATAGDTPVEWAVVEHDFPDEPAAFCRDAGEFVAAYRTDEEA